MSVAVAVATALRSGSIYIANASFVALFLWAASLIIWLFSRDYVWGYACLNFLAFLFFYLRWNAPNPQHRQFHFLMMIGLMTNPAFYAYQQVIAAIAPKSFGMSIFWYKLADNVIYELELILIVVYALLRRRARADVVKWRQDVDGWFSKAGDVKRGVKRAARSRRKPPDDK